MTRKPSLRRSVKLLCPALSITVLSTVIGCPAKQEGGDDKKWHAENPLLSFTAFPVPFDCPAEGYDHRHRGTHCQRRIPARTALWGIGGLWLSGSHGDGLFLSRFLLGRRMETCANADIERLQNLVVSNQHDHSSEEEDWDLCQQVIVEAQFSVIMVWRFLPLCLIPFVTCLAKETLFNEGYQKAKER